MLAALTFVSLMQPAHAEDQINQDLVNQVASGSWSGNLRLIADVVIPNGAVVTVQKNTTIWATRPAGPERYSITVQSGGQLILAGEPGERVTFDSEGEPPLPADWGGLVYQAGSGGSGTYFTIAHATRGLSVSATDPLVFSFFLVRDCENSDPALAANAAGIYVTNAAHTLSNGEVTNNRVTRLTTPSFGAGITIAGASAVVENCYIANNSVSTAAPAFGAGIAVSNASALIQNNTITGNTVDGGDAGGGLSFGAGVAVDGNTTARILDNEFSDNSVLLTVGGFAGGAAIGLNAFARIDRIEGNYIHDNHTNGPAGCEAGGIVFPFQNYGRILNNLILRNTTGDASQPSCGSSFPIGAGVKIDAAAPLGEVAVTFAYNTVVDNLTLSTVEGMGGGLFLRRGNISVTSSIFAGNNAILGGGIYLDPAVGTGGEVVVIDYNLFFNNAPQNVRNNATFVLGTLNLPTPGIVAGEDLPASSTANPAFIGGSNDDLVRYRITATSAARDAGAVPLDALNMPYTTVDFGGRTRPVGSAADMGAYEVFETDLRMVASGPSGPVGPLQPGTCSFVMTNDGTTTGLAQIVIETPFTSLAAVGAACVANQATCTVAQLDVGESIAVTLGLPATGVSGPQSCTARASNGQIELTPLNNTATATYTLDADAPSLPLLTSVDDRLSTIEVRPLLSGQAEAGATVEIRDGGTLLCTVTATAEGNFSCTLTEDLQVGEHVFTLRAIDVANNASDWTEPISITVIQIVEPTGPTGPPVPDRANPDEVTPQPSRPGGNAQPLPPVTLTTSGKRGCAATGHAEWLAIAVAAVLFRSLRRRSLQG
jgi:hypothetical protein